VQHKLIEIAGNSFNRLLASGRDTTSTAASVQTQPAAESSDPRRRRSGLADDFFGSSSDPDLYHFISAHERPMLAEAIPSSERREMFR
jgi:hypothetical protein